MVISRKVGTRVKNLFFQKCARDIYGQNKKNYLAKKVPIFSIRPLGDRRPPKNHKGGPSKFFQKNEKIFFAGNYFKSSRMMNNG